METHHRNARPVQILRLQTSRRSLDPDRAARRIFALLGDNGAGKTTTIRMLTGLAPPDSGTATILGKDCWAHAVSLRTTVGYVPERPRFYDWMTVGEIGWFTAGFHERGISTLWRMVAQV